MENYALARKLELIITGCIVALIAVVIVAICSVVAVKSAQSKVASYNKLIAELSYEKQNLEKNIQLSESDSYLEEQARGRLRMIRDGEKIYYFD